MEPVLHILLNRNHNTSMRVSCVMESHDVLRILCPTPLELKREFLTKFAPLQPSTIKQNWRQNKKFGFSSPETGDLWNLMEENDFRCVSCKSQYRIQIDHIDDDNKNHSLDNLQLLCRSCNTIKSIKGGIKNPNAQVVIFTEFFYMFSNNKVVPTTRELAKHIKSKYDFKNRPLSGQLHLYNFLVHAIERPRGNVKLKECLETIDQIQSILDIKDEDILPAIISSFTPPDAYKTRTNWKNQKKYAHSAPEPDVFKSLLKNSDYRCNECGSISRLTFDHLDSNPTNHGEENLEVVCFLCNRKRSSKGVKRPNLKVLIFEEMVEHYKDSGSVLSRAELAKRLDGDIGGEFYFQKFMENRLKSSI